MSAACEARRQPHALAGLRRGPPVEQLVAQCAPRARHTSWPGQGMTVSRASQIRISASAVSDADGPAELEQAFEHARDAAEQVRRGRALFLEGDGDFADVAAHALRADDE